MTSTLIDLGIAVLVLYVLSVFLNDSIEDQQESTNTNNHEKSKDNQFRHGARDDRVSVQVLRLCEWNTWASAPCEGGDCRSRTRWQKNRCKRFQLVQKQQWFQLDSESWVVALLIPLRIMAWRSQILSDSGYQINLLRLIPKTIPIPQPTPIPTRKSIDPHTWQPDIYTRISGCSTRLR